MNELGGLLAPIDETLEKARETGASEQELRSACASAVMPALQML